MAEVHPFQGVRYNQRLVTDISMVISPPYDIITPQMAPELYQRSEYNFVRIEANRELPQDTDTDNKYTRSAAVLGQWLEQSIFQIDDVPAIYLHDHYFAYLGREYRRRGITLRIRLEEWDKMVVRPHEGTLADPKTDRLNLLWALQVNTSPILALFDDQKGMVSSVLAEQERNKPVITSGSVGGERHNVWAITDGEAIGQICQSLAHQPVYIADGHHRYESALAYRREMCTCTDSVSGDEPFNFAMMTLVAFDDPGLIILPPHRMIRGISRATLDGAMARLKMFFDIDELSLATPDIWRQVDSLLTSEANTVKLLLFGLAPERLFMLKLRDLNAASRMMPYFHSALYKQLDVSIVDHIILEKVLELSSEREKVVLGYSHSREDAIKRVSNQEYQLAFLLSPVTAETVKAIADAGDRMPRKSTYFYPKAPSGLVFYRLV